MSEDSLRDQLNINSDVKKLERLVESGEITAEELANAPIFLVEPVCKCNKGLQEVGTKLLCPECWSEGESKEETQ